jgi:hypothetical protein
MPARTSRRRTTVRKHAAEPRATAWGQATRIAEHPILSFTPGREVEFSFEDRKLTGYENEPIAVALAANSVKVFRITEKMQRPRGFFCAVGKCSSCLMEVDGRPNVMVCTERLKAGMHVRRQQGRGKLKNAECRMRSAEGSRQKAGCRAGVGK